MVEINNERQKDTKSKTKKASLAFGNECKSDTKVLDGSGANHKPSSVTISGNTAGPDKQIREENPNKQTAKAPNTQEGQHDLSTGVKRTADDASLDVSSPKKISKVSSPRTISKVPYVHGKVVPVRSVPDNLKKEWKDKKIRKKKKKKH